MGLRTALGLRRSRVERKAKLLGLRVAEPWGVLYEFCGSLRGRDCIVLGSAPSPDFANYNNEPIICCNGSALSLQRAMGRAPDYTFMHSHVLARWNQSDKEVRQALENVKGLGKTVVFHDPKYTYTTELISSRVNDVMSFDWDRRHEIVTELLNVSLPFLACSTGAIVAASVLRAGARSVRLVGFSLANKGHSYNDKDRYRNHVRSDAALFALLGQAGFNISSREPSISMILTEKIS